MENEAITSGFVGQDLFLADARSFTDLREIYSSASGYNRLFRGERYGRVHVLKALQEPYVGSGFHEQALRKEFNIGYQLEHPHICRTLGWEQLSGMGHCILLEYIDGMTLRDFMEQGKLTDALARKFVSELCDALRYLHSKQIIHRDVKPENILITHNGQNVKLIDFSLSDCDDYGVLKMPAGTRYYLAPEMLQEGAQVDSRADIYSLGVVIGEMAVALKSRKLAAISRKCTQHRPEKRYASAAAIVAELEKKRIPAYRYVAAALVLLAVIGVWVGVNGRELAGEEADIAAFPVYENASGGEVCRRILAGERIRRYRLKKERPQAVAFSEADSIRLMTGLKEALDAEYPLPAQQQSDAYASQWESLKQEAEAILKE